MVVDHFHDGDRTHLLRVYPTVVLAGKGIVIRLKNQSMGVDEVDGVLLVSISSKLMPPIWWRYGHLFQCLGGF